jgi:hypothetical protein
MATTKSPLTCAPLELDELLDELDDEDELLELEELELLELDERGEPEELEELDELLELDELELLLAPVLSPPQPETKVANAINEIHKVFRRVLLEVICRVHCLLVSLLEPS